MVIHPVDEMIKNAGLREDLAPFDDEALSVVYMKRWPVSEENRYLTDLLEWEYAPVRPIAQWFNPPLAPPPVSSLSDSEVHRLLDILIQKLYEKKCVFDFTDHLSDRALYNLIVCRVLPAREKMIESPQGYRHWDCSYTVEGEEEHLLFWLTYYASDEERSNWETEHGEILPPKQTPLYPRHLPRDPEK